MRINKTAAWIFCLLPVSILLLNGCTSSTTSRSSSLQREVDELRAEVSEMRNSSDPTNEIYQLRAEVQRLSDNMAAAGQSGPQEQQQLAELNARLVRLEKQSGLPSDSRAIPIAPTPEAAAATSVNSVPPLPPTANAYEDGKALYDQGQFREAISRFKSYLAAEPKGANAAAAQFYTGEALYSQKKYEEAILAYKQVVEGFPKSSQVPTSILKQGFSFQTLGQKDIAKLLYQKVTKEYPKSYAAGVAKERLKSL
ncbi:MAG: tol-pal system protein YbgF [Candidatus Adiutrix sp.]|jgi:tol-pal system protein YbgF|nr:tol-pal system protein YbgF [Candidatus Adiutrix sp.]